MRDAKRVFACREFEGAPKLDGQKHTFLVLDGQQRLTSLYQAFYGVGEHRYYLDLRKLLDGADFEEAVFHIRATTKWAKVRESFDFQAKELLLPLSVLKGGAGGFLQWLLQTTNRMPQVIAGLATGLEILRDDCKVVLQKWLPYQTMLVPLTAVLARVGLPKTPQAGVQREKLKRWFWCAVFGQAYESAPNSQSAKDVAALVDWLGGGDMPETITTFRFDPKVLREATPRQRSIYRGAICLILANGARDFHTQAVITDKLINDEGIDDHHVFPAKFLENTSVTSARMRDCVLNRTLIDRTTNQIISARAPSQYLAEIRHTPGFPFEAVLASHCLPTGDNSPFWTDDYETFLQWRQDRLWQDIRRVTGVVDATDLEGKVEEAA